MNSENLSIVDAGWASATDSLPKADCSWEIWCGEGRMAELQAAITDLAGRSGQAQLVENLGNFLSNPYPGSRQPAGDLQHLGFRSEVFVQRSKRPVIALQWSGRRLEAAVIFHEYRLYGVPTTLYVSADPDGWRTVIAHAEQRLDVATRCAELLISKGATLVLVSLIEAAELGRTTPSSERVGTSIAFDAGSRLLLGHQRRKLKQRLHLMPDYDSTLRTLGTRTRRNFRAMTRRVMNELGCEYHANAKIAEDEFLEAYRRSTHPMPDWIARWRYRAIQSSPGAFLAGMRNLDGVWLGLIGGRRSGDMTFVDWQINAVHNGPLSLGTALRAFLVENEHVRGISLIHFEGGTSHTMSHAFLDDGARDLLFARPDLPARLLRVLARFFPPGGLLSQVILGSGVEWTQSDS